MIGTGCPVETFRRMESRQSDSGVRLSRNEWQSSDSAWLVSELDGKSAKVSATKPRSWFALVKAVASKFASMLF